MTMAARKSVLYCYRDKGTWHVDDDTPLLDGNDLDFLDEVEHLPVGTIEVAGQTVPCRFIPGFADGAYVEAEHLHTAPTGGLPE
jgi:hypothetical protein